MFLFFKENAPGIFRERCSVSYSRSEDLTDLLEEVHAVSRIFFSLSEERFSLSRSSFQQLFVAVFTADEVLISLGRVFGFPNERFVEVRVVAVQRPVTGIHSTFLLDLRFRHVDTMEHTGSIGNDDGRTIVRFSFADRGQRLLAVGTHGNAGDVDVAVAHAHKTEVLLGHAHTVGGKERDSTDRGGLGSLTAGVGVNFSIQHEDVDVAVLGNDVIQTAVTDVVSPSVTAEDPDGFIDEVIFEFEHLGVDLFLFAFGFLNGDRQDLTQFLLVGNSRFVSGSPVGNGVIQSGFHIVAADTEFLDAFDEVKQLFAVGIDSDAHTETVFGVILKRLFAHAGPRPSLSLQ